jgi:hypothetical protein
VLRNKILNAPFFPIANILTPVFYRMTVLV